MCLRVDHQHSQFWPILARFMHYYSPFRGPGVISMVIELQGALMCRSSTLAVSVVSCPFHGLLLTVLGPQSDSRFMDYYSAFWGPRAISTIDETGVRLCVSCQNSQFCPILTRFVDYYSSFSGPEAISIVVHWSSTLAVLTDSGPLHALLLTVSGSRSDFLGYRSPRCAYLSIINTHGFGSLWPVSWTIAHCFGVPVISMVVEPRVRLRVCRQHSRF